MEARWPGVRRVAFHLLLAVFVARANDEHFRSFIDWEGARGFYRAILTLQGHAPDQYRILPLLPLRLLEHWMSFRYAVLALNLVALFLCLELFWWTLAHRPPRQRVLVSLLFAALAHFTLYPGWRPDTSALLALCALSLAPLRALPPSRRRDALLVGGITMLSFARADVALVYGIFLQSGRRAAGWARALVLLAPLAVQLLLARVVFPQATTYARIWALGDNLSPRTVETATTFLLLALLLASWESARRWLGEVARNDRPLALACLVLFAAVLCFGRVNEYRLFLPLLPMLLVADGEREGQEAWKASRVAAG